MTPEEKLSAKLTEFQQIMDVYRGETLQQIHDMVAGKVPCVPVHRCPNCDATDFEDLNKHWLDEHSTGDAKRDNNFGVTR